MVLSRWRGFWQRRLVMVGAVGFLLGGLAAALTGMLAGPMAAAGEGAPVTVSFLTSAIEAENLQVLAQEFEANHPHIRVQVVAGPNATDAVENLYTTSFLMGDSPYDAVFADVVWIPKFAAAGWLQPVGDHFSAEELAAFLPSHLAAGQYRDELYRVPFRSSMGLLYYRADLLADVGLAPPETFAELVAAAQAIQQEIDVPWGYVWQGLQYEGLVTNFVEIVAGFGGFWLDADTLAVGLDQPEAVQAVEFMQSLITQGISPPGVTNYLEVDSLRLFEAGQVAFLRNWPYAWGLANGPDSTIAGQVGLKPMVHAPGQTSAACLGGWGFGVSATTPHPAETWEVVRFFTSRPAQKRYVLDNAYVPSRRDLFTDPDVLQQFPHYQQLLAVAERAVPRPPVGQYAQVSDILQRYLSAALSGQMTAERAMAAAAGETRRVLGRVN